MRYCHRFLLIALVLTALIAANPLDGDPALQKADERYATAMQKAEGLYLKAKVDEAEKRLRAYRTGLETATKAGNFDKAQAIKSRIEAFEAGAARPRPKDVAKHAGHEYAVISDKVTWHTAKRLCEEMGGHLACVETPQENAFLLALCGKAGTELWIGGSDEQREGEWFWITGTRIEVALFLDNSQGCEHSLAYLPERRVWNDTISGGRIGYVCEWDD